MEPSNVFVSELLEDYRADFLLRGCRSIRSLRTELSVLSRHFGTMAVADIGIRTLRHYQADRREQGMAPATVNKELAVLSAALSLAELNELIPAAPRFPPRLRPGPPRQGFLSHDDYLAIRAQLPEWGIPVLDFGYYSGWRKSEILGLTRDEVDLDEKCVRLDPARSKNGEARPIPLQGFGLAAIEKALELPNDHGLVFHRERLPIRPTTWHTTWKRAVAVAGVPNMHFHDLRRTVVRRLEFGGVPRKVAMAWVGHKTEAIYQRYCITLERDLTMAAEKMLSQMGEVVEAGNVIQFPSRLSPCSVLNPAREKA